MKDKKLVIILVDDGTKDDARFCVYWVNEPGCAAQGGTVAVAAVGNRVHPMTVEPKGHWTTVSHCDCGAELVEKDLKGSVYEGTSRTRTICRYCGIVLCLGCAAWGHEGRACLKQIRCDQGQEAYERAAANEDEQTAYRRQGDWRMPLDPLRKPEEWLGPAQGTCPSPVPFEEHPDSCSICGYPCSWHHDQWDRR